MCSDRWAVSISADPAIDLDRFVSAQDGVYHTALAEIRRGRKTSHWMWFVFPQIQGLGRSPTAQYYAIRSLAESRFYLDHPLLGQRLRESVAAIPNRADLSAEMIFGAIDAMKLRSSLTLFAEAGDDPVFVTALWRWFGGIKDETTLRLLTSHDDIA